MAWLLDNDRPIYAQIVEKIRLRIIAGYYKSGEKLSSVRELAAEAGVNPNTMQRAFVELERSELIQTQRTSGRMVTEDTEMIQKVKREIAEEQVKSFIEKMKELGFEKEETVSLFQKLCEEGE